MITAERSPLRGPFGGDSNGDLGDDGGDSGDSGTGVSSVVASTDRCSYEQRLAGIERSKRHMTVIAIGAGQVQPVVACFGSPQGTCCGFAALVWLWAKPRAHQHRGAGVLTAAFTSLPT